MGVVKTKPASVHLSPAINGSRTRFYFADAAAQAALRQTGGDKEQISVDLQTAVNRLSRAIRFIVEEFIRPRVRRIEAEAGARRV